MRIDSDLKAWLDKVDNLLRFKISKSDYIKVLIPFIVLQRVVGKQITTEGITDPDVAILEIQNIVKKLKKSSLLLFEELSLNEKLKELKKANALLPLLELLKTFDFCFGDKNSVQIVELFETIVGEFSRGTAEEYGAFFTPPELVELMSEILFLYDDDPTEEKNIYDPTCGAGAMLLGAGDFLKRKFPDTKINLYGQDLNTYCCLVCKSVMLMSDNDGGAIYNENTLTEDMFKKEKFDYILANPPYGVKWNEYEKVVTKEHKEKGFDGRFGAGLPPKGDGIMLFLMHSISKMRKSEKGSRMGIIVSSSMLINGGAGSGQSEIRRWMIEGDMLETVIALPEKLFMNTSIPTYFLVLTNKKKKKGKVKLIDAVNICEAKNKKQNYFSKENLEEILNLYKSSSDTEKCLVLDNEEFGHCEITIDQPMRDDDGNIVYDMYGQPKPNPKLRSVEEVPLSEKRRY